MTERLRGRVALVFGAGSAGDAVSNGSAASLAFGREGAAVAAVDLDTAAARRTAEAIRAEGGTGVALTADATDESAVAVAVAEAQTALGPIDVLHNNVGATVLGGPATLPYEQWRQAYAINVDSVFLTCKHVLPSMLERGRGAIVNVSSVAGLRHVGYDFPAYASSKAAVNQLTVSLALTHAGRGIRVNAVVPGLIDTPLVRRELASQAGSIDELLAERNASSPTGRMGTPWDVANAAVFLASDDASYVNAVCLPVDGGLSGRCA